VRHIKTIKLELSYDSISSMDSRWVISNFYWPEGYFCRLGGASIPGRVKYNITCLLNKTLYMVTRIQILVGAFHKKNVKLEDWLIPVICHIQAYSGVDHALFLPMYLIKILTLKTLSLF
jgi:hypothetical protein